MSDHLDAELQIKNYKIFRSDRTRRKAKRGRSSGGVAIYIRDDVAPEFKVITRHCNGVNELLVLFSEKSNTILSVLYRQPDDSSHGHTSGSCEFQDSLTELKKVLCQFKGKVPDIFLLGDFNLPHINWKTGTIKAGVSHNEKEMIDTLINFMNEFHLSQCITEPTHKDGNTLDLLLVNNKDIIHSFKCIPNLSSHHNLLEITMHFNFNPTTWSQISQNRQSENEFETFNFFNESIDWEGFNKDMADVNWESEFDNITPEHHLQKLLKILLYYCRKYIPIKKSFNKNGYRIPRDRRILMRRRRKLVKRLSHTFSPKRLNEIKENLTEIELQLQLSHKRSRKADESKAVNSIKVNPKYFFSYAKKHSKTKARVGPLYSEGMKSFVNTSKEMADILQDQYVSVFSKPNDTNDIPYSQQREPIMQDIVVTEKDVIAAINTFSQTSAAGPDGVPAILLKKCKLTLAKPLASFWNNCLALGVIPLLLKTSHIVPIDKGGNQGLPSNYRPVALTSLLTKTFEKIIKEKIVKYIDDNSLFNNSQHGFRTGRSCLSQLLAHFDAITTFLEKGSNVDVIYLDFSKAFDKVDHKILLCKLKNLGINPTVLEWIKSFLTGRIQVVTVNGMKSYPAEVISGVPQGSVLGPLLFILMIGDIDDDIKWSLLSCFADDTRLVKEITNLTDTFKLQSDLNSVYQWTINNNMQLNGAKFEHLCYGKNEELKMLSTYLSSDVKKISTKKTVKDLGIIMSSDCSFREHITQVVARANSISGWILRTFESREPLAMLTLYKSLVIPYLDYCSQLWSPLTRKLQQDLEMVQRNFVKKINGTSGLSYWQQLKKLNLYSLERRRERYIIIYIWKIIEGLVPNFCHEEHGNSGISWYNHIRLGRKCRIRTVQRGAYQQIRYGSLAVQGPRIFNCLPRDIRNLESCSNEVFKRRLDTFLQTVPDEPLIPNYTGLRRKDSNSIIEMSGIGLYEMDA